MKKITFFIFLFTVLLAASSCAKTNNQTALPATPEVNNRAINGQAGNNQAVVKPVTTSSAAPDVTAPAPAVATSTAPLSWPISDARARVTKKPFGIHISPGNSPVSPERFTGYHTGVDFEILPGEENIDVPIKAICAGKLLVKEYGSGYGGVISQQCKLNEQDITVVYGHLKLSSIKQKVGDIISTGEQIGIPGKGYSQETDGERKHLHLGIHKGKTANLHGYVATKAELSGWLDPLVYLP